MVSRRQIALAAVFVLAIGATFVGVALAQSQPLQATQPVPYSHGDTMPASMFYWVIGIATTICGSLVAAIKILWGRFNKPPDNKGTEASLAALATGTEALGTRFQEAETRWAAERTELRAELTRWQDRYFRQQTKMEKLAVRTQRAVESVAGMETPAVESDLDDDEDQG